MPLIAESLDSDLAAVLLRRILLLLLRVYSSVVLFYSSGQEVLFSFLWCLLVEMLLCFSCVLEIHGSVLRQLDCVLWSLD